MRLQLTVQRHGLPPVRVLWTFTSVVRPPLLAAGNSITISQFLEEVNEVLPLESEDWGLEDYAVEVRGFECLHFSELNQVLKEDDEVCIRPLQTQDLRFRKISGRHQIAVDGKHLIDGVAFGRPFLRRADRPAIRIPPRKRRRITFDEVDDFDTEEPNNERQVVVGAGFENVDEVTAGEESDDEEDFAPDDDEEDLGAELEDLQDELDDVVDADDSIDQDNVQPQRITRSRGSPKGLGLLKLLDENGIPFPGLYNNPLLNLYDQDESQPEPRLRNRGTTGLTQNSTDSIRSILRDSSTSPQRVTRRDLAGSNRSVRFDNEEVATPATIRELEDLEDWAVDEIEVGNVDESDKENAAPHNQETESSDDLFEGSQSSSSTSSDEQLPEDDTSSSGSSSSSSSSDSELEQKSSKSIAHESGESETSSSGSSTSSSSDSEAEPHKTGQKRKYTGHDVETKKRANGIPRVANTSASAITPPGNGSKLTRRRNQRRRESKKLNFIKRNGILPATATKSDLHKLEEATTQSERQKMIVSGENSAAFEAKRLDLLASITVGGVDVGLGPSLQQRHDGINEDQSPVGEPMSKAAVLRDRTKVNRPAIEGVPRSLKPRSLAVDEPSNAPTNIPTNTQVLNSATEIAIQGPLGDPMSTAMTATVPHSNTAPHVDTVEVSANSSQSTPGAIEASESQHRRSRLDMPSAKRMLFGSLGLRTPKTKDDELKTREKLMKDVRPVKDPYVNEEIDTMEDIATAAAVEDESWKDKIDLRAVECCYEGIELSTPPFPFVQRWDPQQQRGYSMGNAKARSGKRGKKRKRNDYDNDNDSSLHLQNQATPQKQGQYEEGPSKLKSHSKVVGLDKEDGYGQGAESGPLTENANAESNDQEHSYDEKFDDSVGVNKQLLHETEDASADTLVEVEEAIDLTNDLPNLPEDISKCSSLTLGKAAKGNIIAFKQLEMSAKTNWQPQISDYRTAIVDEILDDGTLSMTLAKRDQPLNDIQYDEQTGERLYSKFEMPDYHDESDEDKNGKLEISIDELINPILVEATSKKGIQNAMIQGQAQIVANDDPNETAVTAEEVHDTDAGLEDMSLDGRNQVDTVTVAAKSSEEARQEIAELIRDVGWRSSINHELIDRQDNCPPSQNDDLNEPASAGPASPKVRDSSSSPLTNEFQVASSPPTAAFRTSRQIHTSGSEIAESVYPQHPNDSPARSSVSNNKSAIDYPDLPQVNDDSEIFQQEAQDRSGLSEADHQIASQDLASSSSIHRSQSSKIASPILTSLEKSSPRPVSVSDGAGSDESLPELFSQAFEKQMSQAKDTKPELPSEDSISPPSHRRSKRSSRMKSSQRESNRDWLPDFIESELDSEGESTPRQSQPEQSSQIVDLTISSDTVDQFEESYVDEDSYILPKGPGWVQKSSLSEHGDGPTKKTTRALVRSR